MTTRTVVRLTYGCVAEVVLEESDRVPYVPPPVPRDGHAETCGCPDCVMLRSRKTTRRGVTLTPLTCYRCSRPISDCQCPDIDARLRAVAHDPEGVVMFKWCRLCDTHYARCHCGTPEFFIICAGADITAEVMRGLQNAAGETIIPDLRRA